MLLCPTHVRTPRSARACDLWESDSGGASAFYGFGNCISGEHSANTAFRVSTVLVGLMLRVLYWGVSHEAEREEEHGFNCKDVWWRRLVCDTDRILLCRAAGCVFPWRPKGVTVR